MSDQPLNNLDCDRFFGAEKMNDKRGPTMVEISVTIKFAHYFIRIELVGLLRMQRLSRR
jgi:hypothetical protein